jgi:hypothetical protein
MADENTYSDAADLRVASLLNRVLLDLTFDPTALRQFCAFIPNSLNGSIAVKQGLIQRSYAFAAAGEDTAGSNTAVVDASVTLTPAARTLKFYQTDLAHLTAGDAGLDAAGLARIAYGNLEHDYTDLICVAGATATTNVGGSGGADASIDDVYDALYALRSANAEVQGSVGAFKHNSMSEIIASLRGETGALQFQPATAAMLSARGPGYYGSLLGIEFFSLDSVNVISNVNQNFIAAPGAIGYTYAAVGRMLPLLDTNVVVSDAMAYATVKYDDDKGSFRIVCRHYPAVSVLNQSRLVGVLTDDA